MSTELFTHLDNQPCRQQPIVIHEWLLKDQTPTLVRSVADGSTTPGRRAVAAFALMSDTTGEVAKLFFGEHDQSSGESLSVEIHEAALRFRRLLDPHLTRLYTPKQNYPLFQTICSM